MIIITVKANGWQCSDHNNDFHKTITGASASREAWTHMATHDGEVKIKDERLNQEWTRDNG